MGEVEFARETYKYLCKINSGASQMLDFSIITRHELTAVAQNDALIISFGEFGLSRSIDNHLKSNYYINQYMRQAGRFLLEMKKVTEGKVYIISGCIKPENYDMVTTAALNMAKLNIDDETDLAGPPNAINLNLI